MTFTTIVAAVQDRLNLRSTDAATRIGSVVNSRYQEILAELGLQVGTRVVAQASGAATVGSPVFTFSGIEKIERVYYLDGTTPIFLNEVTFDELRLLGSTSSGDTPSMYAVQTMVASAVTIRVDMNAATTYTLKADGEATATTLSGALAPALPTPFHYLLVEAAVADELLKMEKPQLAAAAQGRVTQGLSKLRLYIAKSAGAQIYQQTDTTERLRLLHRGIY